MIKLNLLTICGDPGGTKAVVPVISDFTTDGRMQVINFAYNEATDIMAQCGLPFTSIPDQADTSWAMRQIYAIAPSILITSTSFNAAGWEKYFTAIAKELGIPSLAILDFWFNYALRFSDTNGKMIYLPDRIAIMDERARREMIKEGFDSERLIITGQPAFDSLVACRRSFTLERKAALRDSLGVNSAGLLILFASQPLGDLYGRDSSNPRFLGYDERSVLKSLIKALDNISILSGKRITLLVRPHPRERGTRAYNDLAPLSIDVVVSSDGSGREWAMAADMVSGMNTELLVEACYLGCIVVSLQPGLRKQNALPTNDWGLSRGVYCENDIFPIVKQMLLDEDERHKVLTKLADLCVDGKATKRVAKLVYDMATI